MNPPPLYADPDIGCLAYRHPRHIAVVTYGPYVAREHTARKRRARPPRTDLPVNHRGARLWRWRREQQLSQQQVAAMLGVRPGAISRWERGVDTMPGKYLPQLGITGRKYMVEG